MTVRTRTHFPRPGVPLPRARKGAVLLAVLVCVIVILLLGATLIKVGSAQRDLVRADERRLQAEWLAESGLDRASARLHADGSYRGETWDLSADDLAGPRDGRVVITVEPVQDRPRQRLIKVRADYPRAEPLRARQSKQLVIELSSEPTGGDQTHD